MRPMVSPARATDASARASDERTEAVPVPIGRPRPRTIGHLRLPITLTHRPWATLFELPDGRRMWCLRLWEEDRPVRRCFSTGYLIAFARLNAFDALRAEIEEIAGRV